MAADPVPVTQADCDLAHDIAYKLTGNLTKARAYEERERDDWPVVQGIAKHRQQAENEMRDKMAIVIYDTAIQWGYGSLRASQLQSAIRGIDAGGEGEI